MSTRFPTRQIAKLGGHNGPVHALTYSSGSGQYILTGSTDRTIRLFNPSKASLDPTTAPAKALIQRYEAHGYEVLDLAVGEDNARFASVGGDKAVFLWDVARAVTVRRFAGHAGRVNAVRFGGVGEGVVASGSFDATVKLWDTKSNSTRPIMDLKDAKDSISSLAVIDAEIIAGSIDGRVRTYDIRMGEMLVDVVGPSVTSICPTKQYDSLLVSSLDSAIRLFDKANGKLLQSFKEPSYTNTSYRLRSTLCMNDSTVLSGSEDGQIFAWDLLDGHLAHKMRHAEGSGSSKKDVVSAVAFCDARAEWASAGGDGIVVVWGS